MNDENIKDCGGNLLGDALRVQNLPESMLSNNHSVNFNNIKSEEPKVIESLPPRHDLYHLHLTKHAGSLSNTRSTSKLKHE